MCKRLLFLNQTGHSLPKGVHSSPVVPWQQNQLSACFRRQGKRAHACAWDPVVRPQSRQPRRSTEPAQKVPVDVQEPAQTIHPSQVSESLSLGISTQGGLPPPKTHPFLPFTSLQRQGIKSSTVQRCLLIFLLIFPLKISL